jgi:inner membrane protein
VRTAILFGIIGMLPDLDLLTSLHRGPTHALGAAVIVGLAALAGGRRGRFGLAVAAAWASHTLLDWLGTDSSAPIGLMALWPLSSAYYESPFHVFHAISRRYWLEGFWDHNLRAVAREVLILGPPAAVVWWFRLTRPPGRPRV